MIASQSSSLLNHELEQLYQLYKTESVHYFGYPEKPVDYSTLSNLTPFYAFHLNNVGDPWQNGNWRLHTKNLEQEVLHYFANLYHIQDDYWGYITNGGTEGNLFALYQARKILSKQHQKPIILTSDVTHYSIAKSADILGLELEYISSQKTGEIDYTSLTLALKKFKKRPIILVLNLGTTMTGAMDSVNGISEQLKKEHISQYYIHVDGALNGAFYPWMKNAQDIFKLGIGSISISGHKFFGAIHPCGVLLTRDSLHKEAFSDKQKISYISVDDTPISGSRDGMHALILWYLIKNVGSDGFKRNYEYSVNLAHYLRDRLFAANIKDVIYPEGQIIVAFKNKSIELAKKYQLPFDSKGYSHIVCRPDMTKKDIDEFIRSFVIKN